MKKLNIIVFFTVLFFSISSAHADEWDSLIAAAKEQAPSKTKRKTKSGKRLLREKAQRIKEIDIEAPVLVQRKRYDAAEEVLKEALKLTIEAYGPEDIRVADRFASLGVLYIEMGEASKAIKVLNRALRAAEPLIGKDEFQLANIYQLLAAAHYELGEFGEAESNADSLLAACIDRFGPKSSQAAQAKQLLNRIYEQKAKQGQAGDRPE